MGWNKESEYFSGQGVLLMGLRSATGKPMGLRHVGNVPALSIGITQETVDHKESQTGTYSTDKTIVRSTDVTASAQLEDFNSANIAMLLNSIAKPVAAGSVTDVSVYASLGAITPLDHLKVSDVVVTAGSTTLVEFDPDNESAHYDYKVNADAGSIEFSPDAKGLGLGITAVAVGATTALTVDSHTLKAGDVVQVQGFTGDDATAVNGKWVTVVSATPTQVVVALDTTGLTLTTTESTTISYEGMSVTVSYTHASFTEVEALTKGKVEMYWRFEGLNASDSEFTPVVVDMFKVSSKPLQELALISDQIQSFPLEANILADTLRAKPLEKSAYFSVRKIDKVA